jgi:hypothetical protein
MVSPAYQSLYFRCHIVEFNMYITCSLTLEVKVKLKVKLSLYRPWRPLGLREVEAPAFSDMRLTDGGKVVSPMRRPLFTPRKIPDTLICYRLSRLQGHSAAGRIR